MSLPCTFHDLARRWHSHSPRRRSTSRRSPTTRVRSSAARVACASTTRPTGTCSTAICVTVGSMARAWACPSQPTNGTATTAGSLFVFQSSDPDPAPAPRYCDHCRLSTSVATQRQRIARLLELPSADAATDAATDGTTDANADAAVVTLCSETETTKHLLLNYLQAAASTDPAADTAQTHLLCERRLEALALGDHAHEPLPLLLMAGASGTSERSSRSSPFSANSTRSCNVSPAARGEATASPSRVARSRQP